MDAIDRRILAELQHDGRLSLTELAERVQLSMSPTHRRLRALEASGAITGYRAVIDPDAVGMGFGALVFVTMDQANRATVPAFDEAVAEIPEVIQALRLFGDPDYLLRVAVPDLSAYQRLWDERLSALPGVRRVESTLVMKTIVDDRPLPV
ncbi:Lrp/AsnC family transcriptional regulator [Agromyces binzhouensis]|uniref:Lrp/AsnC family transcriptional regulator n=1 Tax=Agromyces binzhouensis TaxID=1817495 RepID=A0A4Q2JQ88_9MICO|nr:Lrp/AsnC family transcriptional regulator [Agromyces binzhouensis]RXZ48198.1 Lrp/AsnC family transcriptional regulator [Agromyces binzhouensis]